MKLVRHKKANWHLKWNYDDYAYAIIAHYRKTEQRLMAEAHKDWRWWDVKSEAYKESKRLWLYESKRIAFDRFTYDDEIRDIIKKVESSYNS